ncbi:MAG: hypothetical protein AAGU27_19200 [Dehalobacterium sp.]
MSINRNYDILKVVSIIYRKVVVLMFLPAEFFWRLFEQTGSIAAYIIYRKLIMQ